MSVMDNNTKEKYTKLKNYMSELTKTNVGVAFSGGVDSALLLKVACDACEENNTSTFAITVITKLHPKNDSEIAEKVANEMGAVYKTVTVDEINDAGIAGNPKNRCYLCKREIFRRIKAKCAEYNVFKVIDGTNADDLKTYRPGIAALKELEIKSPLVELGITKQDVREMSKCLGISVANRPSSPCLATRLPYDTPISYELLEKINVGENYLKDLGFYNVRLRVHGDIVRIEVDKEDIGKIFEHKDTINQYVKDLGFKYVTVDLNGFKSGSMDL